MKKLLSFALICICTMNLFAQTAFEGSIIIATENSSNGETGKVILKTKDRNHSMAFNTKSSKTGNLEYTLLINNNDENVYFLTKGSNKYSSIASSDFTAKQNEWLNASAKSTDETKLIAGISCKKVIISNLLTKTICWVSSENQMNIEFPAFLQNSGVISVLKKNNINGIPMEMITLDENGNTKFSQQVISIKAEKIADSEFKIPAGYEKVSKEK